MTSYIARRVSKKILGESMENKWGAKDPVFEQVPATRLDGRPNGKFKKVRKALPPGISEHDAQILTKVKRRAYKLDMSLFSFMGIRFGWGSVVGLVPIAGDFVDAFMALMVVATAKKVDGGLPPSVLYQMYFWVIADLVIGFIPFLGDLFDAMIKANARNAVILEDHLRKKGKENLRKAGQPIPDLDPSDPQAFDRLQSEPPPEYSPNDPREHGHSRQQSSGVTQPPAMPPRPQQAQVHDDRRGGGSGGFFGLGGSKKSRRTDLEMGTDDQFPARKSTRRG